MKKYIAFLLLFFLVPAVSYAHSGGTDANGGHNSSTGYHYHHGYPAHQHENGQCPYEFDDKTGWNSGNNIDNENSSEQEEASTSPIIKSEPETKNTSPFAQLIFYIFYYGMHLLIAFSCLLIVYIMIFELNPERKKRLQQILSRIENFIFLPEVQEESNNEKNEPQIKQQICYAEPIGAPPFKQTVYVYITKSGSRYHTRQCSILKNDGQQIELSLAKKNGYQPCSKCNPPR